MAPEAFSPSKTSPQIAANNSPGPEPPSAPTEPSIDAKLPDVAAWIIIASRSTPEEAKLFAEQHVKEFPSTTVIKSTNGSFAVTIGWLNKEYGRPLKDSLISRSSIPAELVSQQRGKI